MNDRLKELACKACLEYQPSFDALTQYGCYSHSQYDLAIEKLLENFAELIIDDCISEINSLDIVYHNGRAVEEVVHHLMVLRCNIKNHFGIK